MKLAQRILDNLMAAVLWFDRDLYLQYINPAGESLLQLSANQACGLHAEVLFTDCQCFQRVMAESRTITEHGLKIGILTGSQLTVDCSITPIRDPHYYSHNNNELGIIPPDAFLVEMVNVDQQLRLTREEDLSLRRRAVHNLLRGLAHEIKNPLGGLRGAAQLLARELPAQQREYTDIIIGEADRLQTLLDRMLGPRTLPRKEWVNIHKVLCLGKQLINNESGEKIVIIEDYDPSVPEIFADPDQLHQAFLNLLRNAVQAMNGSGILTLRTRIEHRVKLDTKLHKMAVRVDIQDNGPGIPEEIFEHIFYPMVTGRAEGTGLGLTIAQNLVHRNGGTISCESRPSRTVFSISLPITT